MATDHAPMPDDTPALDAERETWMRGESLSNDEFEGKDVRVLFREIDRLRGEVERLKLEGQMPWKAMHKATLVKVLEADSQRDAALAALREAVDRLNIYVEETNCCCRKVGAGMRNGWLCNVCASNELLSKLAALLAGKE